MIDKPSDVECFGLLKEFYCDDWPQKLSKDPEFVAFARKLHLVEVMGEKLEEPIPCSVLLGIDPCPTPP